MSMSVGLSQPCPLPMAEGLVPSVVSYLDLPARTTLSKVSRYFRTLLESEASKRQFLAQQSFRPLLTGQERTFQQYDRFQAMHSAYPSMVRYHEEFVEGNPICVRVTPDGSTMAFLCRNPCY